MQYKRFFSGLLGSTIVIGYSTTTLVHAEQAAPTPAAPTAQVVLPYAEKKFIGNHIS